MIRRINYDFNLIVEACGEVIYKPDNKNLSELRKEINKFFKDSYCVDIIYTKNDSLFFGMSVYPITDKEFINAVIQDDGPLRFKKYSIEIDSKLLDPFLDIKPREFTAMLLHEIGHIINDPTPVEKVRDAINFGLIKSGESIDVPKSIQYYQILAYGIKNAIRKMNSMFFIYKDGEVLADEFVHVCGFGEELNNAFNKICRKGLVLNKDANALTALSWSLTLYKEVKMRRIPALRLINNMKRICGSQIEKRELEVLELALNTVDDNTIVQESYNLNNKENYYVYNENNNSAQRSKYSKLRKEIGYNNIHKFGRDVYEYTMRIRHVSDEEDAMYLMRQINTRISVLEDYLNTERLSNGEREEVFKILDKYYALREKLANDVNYRYDYSQGIITVVYPDIVEDRY